MAVVGVLLAAGCSSPRWPARSPAGGAAALSAPATPRGASAPRSPDGRSTAGPEAEPLQEVIGELQELGALDPAAQRKVMADLRQTDPVLWPLLVRQFRAAVAYRRRPGGPEAAAADAERVAPIQTVSGTTPLAGPTGGDPGGRPSGRSGPPQTAPLRNPGSPQPPGRLPVTDDVALPPPLPPRDPYPATPYVGPDLRPAGLPPSGPEAPGPERFSGVAPAGPAGPRAWHAHVAAAARALESKLKGSQGTPDQPIEGQRMRPAEWAAEHARLRLLYLLAGRRDDAVRPLPSAPPAVQGFWSKQLYALATWLDTQRTPDATRRAGQTKQILQEAATRLGESAPLVVRNLAFCTAVESYGCAKRFQTREFVPGQEVLLYAELENFASEPTPKGFHTALRSSYQVFDSRGQRVADHRFDVTEEYCQNRRRDFFIGYHLFLPERIYPGKHTLVLTVEDLKSHKVGQSSIELTIRDVDQK